MVRTMAISLPFLTSLMVLGDDGGARGAGVAVDEDGVSWSGCMAWVGVEGGEVEPGQRKGSWDKWEIHARRGVSFLQKNSDLPAVFRAFLGAEKLHCFSYVQRRDELTEYWYVRFHKSISVLKSCCSIAGRWLKLGCARC